MSTPTLTDNEAFLMRENQRLLVEVRVLREWVLQLAAARGATSQEDMDNRRDRLEEQFKAQIATQLGTTLWAPRSRTSKPKPRLPWPPSWTTAHQKMSFKAPPHE